MDYPHNVRFFIRITKSYVEDALTSIVVSTGHHFNQHPPATTAHAPRAYFCFIDLHGEHF